MERIQNLSQGKLLDLLAEYNKYIQEANEEQRYKDGWYPVCISEFYTNEYQLIVEERKKNVN